MMGEYDEELEAVRSAQEYAPGALMFLQAEARALAALGRVAEVPRVIDRILSIAPTAGWPGTPGRAMDHVVRELRAHGYRAESQQLAARAVDWYRNRPPGGTASREHREGLARALYLAERWEGARGLFSALAADDPDELIYTSYLGKIAARTGDVVSARAMSSKLARVEGRYFAAVATAERASIAALLGERERAVELFRDAITQGVPHGLLFHNNPELETLRDYQPHVDLVRPRH